MERDFLGAIGRPEKAKEDGGTEQPDDNPGAPPVAQWQFPTKPSATPAFMSFRAGREDGSKEFSVSGFRQPAARGDSFDCIKKQASLPALTLTHHRRQSHLGLDAPMTTTPPYAVTTTHGHRVQQGMEYGATTHHLPDGGSRMVQAAPARQNAPPPFHPMLRSQSFHGVTGGSSPFKNQPPFTVSNASFGGGSTSAVGAYGARNPRNQNSAQLTIFYNGLVNVFDNVTVEKAQELVLLASRASIPNPPSSVRKPDSPIPAPAKAGSPEVLPARQIVIQKPEPSVPHLSSTSSPMSVVPHAVILPMSTSKCTTESTGPKTAAQLPVVAPTSQASLSQPMALATTSAAAIMPRAVPQARKASLARFLEKRKERVTSVEPYPASKSPSESSDATGSASAPSKSSPTGIAATSSNGEEPLRLDQPRSISFGSEVQHPSTKLQI